MFFKKKLKSYKLTHPSPSSSLPNNPKIQPENRLLKELKGNLGNIQHQLGNSSDIIIREIRIGKDESINAGIIYTDGLTDTTSLQQFIMKALMTDFSKAKEKEKLVPQQNLIELLKDMALAVGEIKNVTDFDTLYVSLLSGDTIFLVDGFDQGLIVGNKKWEERGVTEPTSQTVVRGPREGFSENLRINTALVRRKIKDPNLWMETKVIGTSTKTDVAIMYINGIVNEKIVKEVKERLDRIQIDGILESGNIEELIQDSTVSPFPTILNTERPDVVAAALLDGRIALIIDGTPFVLIVPALFVQFFQSPEDYYHRAYISSLIRLLRFFSYGIALLAPSLFIALTTFHLEMIPTALLINLAAQREGVPFPAFVEALIMEITFEILREAGARMPRSIGPTMSIVGAFVIGTAAVEAGMITSTIVIVVSITAISSFVSPSYDIAIAVRMLRFLMMGLAASFGLFGIALGLFSIVLHLCSLRSFGIPYMSPLAPFNLADQKDTFIRLPIWKMVTRPSLINQQNMIKQKATTKSTSIEKKS